MTKAKSQISKMKEQAELMKKHQLETICAICTQRPKCFSDGTFFCNGFRRKL